MTRRENFRERRLKHRSEGRSVLVVCGGKSTEPAYFDGLKRERRNASLTVVIKKKGVGPERLVRHAITLREQAGGYDETWCVIDVDEFSFDSAIALAAKQRVNLAISNPCFEFWLLLHFEICAAPLIGYNDVERRLLRHVPGYNKSALRFADYSPGIELAIQRARGNRTNLESVHQCNPSTGVWALVEKIM